MLESMSAVGGQVGTLCILIIVGYVCVRKGMITEEGSRQLTDFLLVVVTPCLIINAFRLNTEATDSEKLLGFAGISVCYHIFAALVAFGVFALLKIEKDRKKLAIFSTIFTNCGFMGLPVIQGVLGDGGVIYGSIFLCVFNIVIWTFGIALIEGYRAVSWKQVLINPGTVGLILGLPLMLFSYSPPEFIGQAVNFLAGLNTPLAMVIIGGYIARVNLWSAIKSREVLFTSAIRLALIPCLCLPLLLLTGLDRNQLIAIMISVSAPTAGTCVLFAVRYRKNANLASEIVAVTTLLSIVTMPLLIALSEIFVK